MKRVALILPATMALLVGLAGCGGDLTLPGPPPAGVTLAVLDGNGQQGTVGDALPSPVIVQVLSTEGTALPGRTVVFVSGSPGGFDPDTAVTDDQGHASTTWVMGTAPGPYTAEARVITEGDAAVPPAALQASALAGPPDTVRADSPTLQGGSRGEPVADPPVVVVVDRFGNPVANAEVKWKVEEGNGEVSPANDVVTDESGRSTVTWTLGNRIGVQQLDAEVKDVSGSPVSFRAAVPFF